MRGFVKEIDLSCLNQWLSQRGVAPLEEQDVPQLGSIVEGVACGFLVSTDTSACFLDAFITNPEASSEERDKALRRISRWLISLAQTHGYKRLIVLSKEDSILERAVELGFKMNGSKVLALEL